MTYEKNEARQSGRAILKDIGAVVGDMAKNVQIELDELYRNDRDSKNTIIYQNAIIERLQEEKIASESATINHNAKLIRDAARSKADWKIFDCTLSWGILGWAVALVSIGLNVYWYFG